MFPLAILIGGPTASGKSELAFKLQKKLPSIIINADSMQVYNKLHKLTNSPSNEEVKDFDCNLYNFIKYPLLCDLGIWLKEVKKILNKNSKKGSNFCWRNRFIFRWIKWTNFSSSKYS